MEPTEEQIARRIENMPQIGENFDSLGENQQRAILQAQVFALNKDTLAYKEIKNPTTAQLDMMFDRLRFLSQEIKSWHMLVDLRDAQPPDEIVQKHLRTLYADLEGRGLKYVSFVVQNDVMEKIASHVALSNFRVPFATSQSYTAGVNRIRNFRLGMKE